MCVSVAWILLFGYPVILHLDGRCCFLQVFYKFSTGFLSMCLCTNSCIFQISFNGFHYCSLAFHSTCACHLSVLNLHFGVNLPFGDCTRKKQQEMVWFLSVLRLHNQIDNLQFSTGFL